MKKIGIIVLGDKLNKNRTMSTILRSRLNKCIELYFKLSGSKESKEIYIICSGGISSEYKLDKLDKDFPKECTLMREYLILLGIPANKIITEDKSRTTIENSIYTYELIYQLPFTFNKFYLVTSDFHMTRSAMIFRNTFEEPVILVEDNTEHILSKEEKAKHIRSERNKLYNFPLDFSEFVLSNEPV